MQHRILAGASSFAHLVGLARPKSAKSDDDKDPKKQAAEGDEPKKDDKSDKESKKADDESPEKKDDKESKAGDDKPEDKDDEKKGKKAAKGDDDYCEDDDDKDEMNGKGAASQARQRERERCAAIFSSPHAASNVALAASLAFETTLTRKEVLAVLSKAPAAEQASGREARNPRLGPGGQGGPSTKQAVESSWDAAFKRTARK